MARKKWWVKHPIQARFMAVVLAAMLAPVLIVGGGLYYLVFKLLAKQMAFPEAIAANLSPVVQEVNVWLFLTLPVFLTGIGWVAILMTHRFAGPIERLERELDYALQGHHHGKIKVRQKDALKGLTDRINLILERKGL